MIRRFNMATSPATNVTVNGISTFLFADNSFAKSFTLTNGLNTFTAIARDVYGRSSTNTSSVTVLRTNSAYSYDLNGNLLYDGRRAFAYDDENQLIRVTVTNGWKSEYTYDGKMRRRIVKEFAWAGSWVQTNEVHFVYDGNLVVQERDANNLPQVTYTRGNDLSGTLQGAGGIGGLMARTDNSQTLDASPRPQAHALYHADGNGNVTCLIYPNQTIAAKYLYDPFGNMLSMYGSLADANTYRFSSKEWNANSGLYYYLYRLYDANAQRWLNRDPIGERGGLNLYSYISNGPIDRLDPLGLYGNPVSGLGGPVGPSSPFIPPIILPPFYNPGYWNDPSRINNNNCYNYACDQPTGDFRQPGGGFPPGTSVDCTSLKAKVKADGGGEPDKCGNCPQGTHKIRLWANGSISGSGGDFHFYRQDGNGSWSDKPGSTPAQHTPDPNSYHGYQNCGDICVANQPLH